ncbi:hypothetical protein HDU81_008279 [Chytriomyces hyalinus]|nr:hypothetical protein HDU81_008279 [Chytriomyces hyalinus]
MQLPSTLPRYQKDKSIWLFLPDKYQAAVADKKLRQLQCLDICIYIKTAIPFPESITLLSNLKKLRLSRCSLTGAIPNVFEGLSNLTTLSLSDNQLDGAVPPSFNCLVSLETLDLSRNRLTGHLPDFSGMNALKSLTVSCNQLTGPIPTSIGSPSKLEFMNLVRNQFTSIPNTITNLVKLFVLNISNNPISGNLPNELWRLRELRVMLMAHCGVTGSLAGIGELSLLSDLDVSENDLTGGIPPNELSQLTRLHSLHLFGNPRLCGQVWDFTGLDNFDVLCMDRAVLENSTLCGAFITCESHETFETFLISPTTITGVAKNVVYGGILALADNDQTLLVLQQPPQILKYTIRNCKLTTKPPTLSTMAINIAIGKNSIIVSRLGSILVLSKNGQTLLRSIAFDSMGLVRGLVPFNSGALKDVFVPPLLNTGSFVRTVGDLDFLVAHVAQDIMYKVTEAVDEHNPPPFPIK